MEMRQIARFRDWQRCAGRFDAANFKMGDDAAKQTGAINRLDLDALPCEAVDLVMLDHGQHPANTCTTSQEVLMVNRSPLNSASRAIA